MWFNIICAWNPLIFRFLGISVTLWNWGLVFVESCILWRLLCYLQRYALKALLMYKGWMFDERGYVNIILL